MSKKIFLFFLLVIPFALNAQTYVYCTDSLILDPNYKCFDAYQPVCGCDGKTYRSACAAEHWGGLATSHNYKPGVCDNFDFDFSPNPVSSITNSTQDALLHVYVNDYLLPSSVQIYLFDVYNRLQYSRFLYVTYVNPNGASDPFLSPDFFSSLQKGVYLLMVSVNGETKTKKIIKINIQ